MSRRTSYLACLCLLVSLGSTGTSAGKTKPQPISWLFVTSATSGSLTKKPGTARRYVLTLRGLSRTVAAFADRPGRLTMNVPAKAFFRQWGSDFKHDPPNAALDVVVGQRETQDAVILELRRPRLKGSTLRLDARWLKAPSPKGKLTRYKRRLAALPPRSFRDASLFIDNGPYTNGCGIVCNGYDCAVASGGLYWTSLWPVYGWNYTSNDGNKPQIPFDCPTAQQTYIYQLNHGGSAPLNNGSLPPGWTVSYCVSEWWLACGETDDTSVAPGGLIVCFPDDSPWDPGDDEADCYYTGSKDNPSMGFGWTVY